MSVLSIVVLLKSTITPSHTVYGGETFDSPGTVVPEGNSFLVVEPGKPVEDGPQVSTPFPNSLRTVI